MCFIRRTKRPRYAGTILGHYCEFKNFKPKQILRSSPPLKIRSTSPPTPVRAYFLSLEAPVIGLFCNLLFQQTFVGGGFRSGPKERLYVRPCFKSFRPRGSLLNFRNGIILPEGKNVALKFVVV